MALIPARGGSKRLPGKNVRRFAGRPLLTYSVAFARHAAGIDRCIVSTDDDEIAAVALEAGAEVIRRPASLATDTAPTAAAVVHALEAIGGDGGVPDVVVLLQPNCPLRPSGLAERALTQLAASGADSVISVTPHHHKTGAVVDGRFVPDYVPGTRSQDLAPRVFENGVIYATWSRVVLARHSVFGDHISPLMIDPLFAMGDIDTPLDWEVAEHLFHVHRQEFDWMPTDLPTPATSPRGPR
ncbi:MAG: NTP transferase domain-containing protein [Vicinamibacterales bacterium]